MSAQVDDHRLLDGFRVALEAAVAGLREHFAVIGRNGLPVGALSGLSKADRIERSGELADGAGFRFHGTGCLVTFPDGVEVDFNWSPDDREVFDAWRLLGHARSRGVDDLDQAAVEELLERAASAGILRRHAWGFFSFTSEVE